MLAAAAGSLGLQVGAGAFKIVVAQCHLAGLDLVAHGPACDHRHLAQRCLLGAEQCVLVAGHRFVHVGAVGQHQVVLGLAVVEPIEDAFFFHQPADEVEIGLAVLHAVTASLERTPGLDRDAAGWVFAQHLLDDVERRLVLKDAQIG